MAIRVECDFPSAGESLSLGDLVWFVEQAQVAGASLDTPVVAVSADQDDAIVVALQVELEEPPSGGSLPVRLDRADVARAIEMLDGIVAAEGDARAQLPDVQELRQLLTKLAIS